MGELHRVADQVHQDVLDSVPVGADPGQRRLDPAPLQGGVIGRGGAALVVDDVLKQGADVHLDRAQAQLAGIVLGDVQHVRDMAHQQLARGVHVLDVACLLGAEPGLAQQREVAQQPVQRRADLVAHGGEKIGLGLFPGQRAIPRRDQVGLGLNAVRDVAQEGDEPFAVVGLGRLDRQFDREHLPVGALGLELDPPLADHPLFAALAHPFQPGLMGGAEMVRHDQVAQIAADRLFGGIAKDLFRRGVEIQNATGGIADHHRVQRGSGDDLHPLVGLDNLRPAPDVLDVQAVEVERQQQQRQQQDAHHRRHLHQGHRDLGAALVGLRGKVGQPRGRQPPDSRPDVPRLVEQARQTRDQVGVTAVDCRDRGQQEGVDLVEVGREILLLPQDCVDRGLPERRDAAVEDIEFAAQVPQVRGGVLDRPGEVQLVFEKLHLGLRQRPLDIVGTGRIQQAQILYHRHRHEGDNREPENRQ